MSTVNEQLATLSTLSTLSPEEKRVLLAQLLVKKAGQPGTAPISFAQERMWLVERLNPGSSALNLPVSFRIQGPLDRVALERSLNEIVRRHGTLRTSFVEVDGQLQQVVAPSLNLSVQVGDVAHLTTAEREAEIERLVLATTLHPFDLAQAPLMRAILIRVGADEYLLHLVLHHIVCDGWSITILARELDTFYNAFSTGQPVSLPKLPVQYADFARWQREQMQGETLTKQLDYWRQQLKDSPPLLALPTDHSRPPVRTFRDEHIQAMLAVDLVKMLRGISQQEGATLFMTLLAAFQLLLSRYSGMLDVPVGTPVAGRVRSELEDLIGVFINNLVLRTDLSGNPTFRELLRRVRTVALEAQANQEVPFEKIVEVLQPERSLSHTPLFQVMFNMFSFGLAHAELRGLQVEVTMPPETGANFDMTLYALERAGQVELMLDYNADLFEHARMAELLDQYQHLLGQISAHPDENIAQYSLLTAKAQRLLPDPAQPLRDAGVPSLQAGLAQVASQHAEKNALVDPYGTWRYHELDELSNQLANALRASGIRSADPVAIYADRSAALVLALLGVAKAGACFVILDPAYPAAQLVERLSAARPKGFIQLDAAGALPAAVIAFLTDHPVACHLDLARTPNEVRECLNEWSTGVSPVSGQTDDLLYIVFTSGSTGKPKGILGEQRSLTHFLQWHNQTFAFTPSDRFSMLSGLGHDPLLRDVFTPLWVGATLCIPAEKDIETPGRLAAWMSEQRITVAHLMPAMSELMTETSSDSANSGSTEQASLRYAFFGGDTLTQRHVTQLRRLAGEVTVVNFYGASETPQAMAYHVIHNHTADDDGAGADRNTIPIGHGIVDVQLLVLNSVRHLAGIAEVGEIYVRTPFLARGYLNDDTLTQQRFIRNPYGQSPGDRLYRTGDLGRYLPDGTIEFLGREDRQVKIRGFRVELGDIEAALDQYPGLRDTVVVAHEEAPGDRQLVAYVVPHGQTPSLRDMRSFLAERLPGYMIPTAFILLEALPLTPNNKVDLRALPVPGAARMALESVYVGPRTPVEEVLVDIWTETLQCGSLGIHDNFFELGGHSLLATQVVSRVRQVFRVELPLRVLFEAPTVAGMAAQVEEALQDTTAANAPPIMPDQRQSPVPLSFSQERMWFIQQLQPDSSAYHIAPAARFKGTLNMQALEYSLAEVVRRHEDLRTVFAIVDGQPAQVIAPPSDLRLQVVDLLQLDVPPAERERRAIALARQEAQQPFDLSRGPMLRATLYRLNDDEHLLLTAMHHIVTDAWSMGIMTREVAALYNAYVTARPALLPDLDVQYADYACWQRQWLRDEVLENQLAYWRNKLAGVTVIELPTDRPRPAIQTYHGAIRSFELPDALLNALRRLSLKKGVTLFMTTLAAFKVLLYRYTGQTDVTVGVPVANRRWLAVENLIGTFVNTLPLRTDLSGNPTFNDVLERVRNVALEAFAHQDLSFAKLVAELQPVRDTSHAPLFQIMFNVINVPVQVPNLTGLSVDYIEVDPGGAQYDLSCTMTDVPGHHRVTISYNTDLFDSDTITRFIGHYETLLKSIAAQPDQLISELPILTDAERQQLLVDWNNTHVDYPLEKCVHQLFEEQAGRTPDEVAVVGESIRLQAKQQVRYGDLNRWANQLARHLRTLEVGPGVYVGISMERSVEMVIGLLGILKAGGTYVPLDPAFPRDRLAFMLEDSGARVLLTQKSLAAELPCHNARVVSLDGDWDVITQESADTLQRGASADDLAYVLYTSGSTGKPKGVPIPHRALTNFLLSMQQAPGLQPQDTLLSVTTLSFDIAGLELYLPLITGARVVVASHEVAINGALLLKVLDRCGATVMQATPATWRMLLESGWKGTPGLKILCGGEALPWELADQLLACGESLWNMYGPTETTIWSTLQQIHTDEPITIGRPIANTSVYILDAHLKPVPIGVPGNLYIGGVGLACGYLNRPELSADKFVADPFSAEPGARMYRTDDLARFLPDGRIEHLGRLDHQVKVRGFRIELEEIESVLNQHPAIQQAVVVARDDKSKNKRLVAYAIPQAGQAPSVGELRGFLKEQLPDYMVPSAYVFVDEFPLTPNRKVDRRALPDTSAADISQGQGYVAPRNATENRLVRLWEEVLGVPRVGVTENFFELGGHSLLAVRLFASIEQVFAKHLPLAMIFEEGTVEHMAAVINQRSGSTVWPSLVPIQPRGSKPPLFFVHPFAGDVIGFKVWADYLGDDQPFYGLRAHGLDGVQEPFDCIEDMAAHYIKEIKSVQPVGPYYLGGYCAGGPVAFEMAQQLHAAGQPVHLVAIVNQAPPNSNYYKVVWSPGLIAAFMRNLPYWASDFAHLKPAVMLSRIRSRSVRGFTRLTTAIGSAVRDGGDGNHQHGGVESGGNPAPETPDEPTLTYPEAFLKAWSRYVPKVYPGNVVVFRTERQPLICSFDPQMCWRPLAAGGVEVKLIPGSNTTILSDPYAHEFAMQLRACLDAAPGTRQR